MHDSGRQGRPRREPGMTPSRRLTRVLQLVWRAPERLSGFARICGEYVGANGCSGTTIDVKARLESQREATTACPNGDNP